MKTPRCVACYEPVQDDLTGMVICPAGVVCSRCIRIATGDPYWIYVDGPHPVVVRARTHEEAVAAVRANPRYGGTGSPVMRVSDFERCCRKAK